MIFRLLAQLPTVLEGLLDRLEGSSAYGRTCEDVAVLILVVQRFIADRQLLDHARVQQARFHLRAIVLRALLAVVERRVSEPFLAAYVAGEERAEVSSDPTDFSFFYSLADEDAEAIDRRVMGAAERAYHRWLEDVCLDVENRAFEDERSPFEDREVEVLRVVAPGRGRADRASELSPFLCRPGNRDCLRLLDRLETWFLRRYDVHHAAVMRHHAENLRAGRVERERRLTLHGTRSYVLALLLPALPFLAAIFAYRQAPVFFDWWISAEVVAVLCGAVWLLAYRFMWRKDLTFFHTSVPRIGAGIIVGYLPVFLIDEVWDLAEQAPFYLFAVVVMLGVTTFLYIYVEVQGKLGDPREAFGRARDIFLLGLIQAAGFGPGGDEPARPAHGRAELGPRGRHGLDGLPARARALSRRAAPHRGGGAGGRVPHGRPADELHELLHRHLPPAPLGGAADHRAALAEARDPGPASMGFAPGVPVGAQRGSRSRSPMTLPSLMRPQRSVSSTALAARPAQSRRRPARTADRTPAPSTVSRTWRPSSSGSSPPRATARSPMRPDT